MCSCQVESSSPSLHDLEEYLVMADTHMDGQADSFEDSCDLSLEEDVQALLDQKERDLRLAAELGKALLDRNEELERRNEQTVEEFNQKLEELTQEKYELHLKLENMEGEYENTVKELQYDISQLREQMHEQQQQSHVEDREKARMLRELTEQNERLQEDILLATQQGNEVTAELQFLKKKGRRRSSLNFHVGQLEHLQDELESLKLKREDLERKLVQVTEERDSLVCGIDESQDRILMLERQNREQDIQVHNQKIEILELQETVTQLNSQIEHITERSSNSSHQSQTLFNELSELASSYPMSTEPDTTDTFPDISQADDDFECDDDDVPMVTTTSCLAMVTDPVIQSEPESYNQNNMDPLHEEVYAAYRKLQYLCYELKGQAGEDVSCSSTELSPQSALGLLGPVVQELADLLGGISPKVMEDNSSSSSSVEEIQALQQRIGELQHELRQTRDSLARSQTQLGKRDIELQEKSEQIKELSQRLSTRQDEMRELKAEVDKLQDLAMGDLNSDHVISALRAERDQIFEKKLSLETELTQAKLDVLNLNSQLMVAIQQKVAVSEQLDQWQVDMEEMLNAQMYKRIQEESQQEQLVEQLKLQLKSIKKKSKKN